MKIMIVEDESINRKDISEAVQEAVSRTQKTREHKAAHLHTLFIDSAAFPIYTSGKNVFLVGILHLGQKVLFYGTVEEYRVSEAGREFLGSRREREILRKGGG